MKLIKIKRIYEPPAEDDGYINELDHNEFSDKFAEHIRQKLEHVSVTLLYAAKSETSNNAAILKEWLEEHISGQ